MLTPEEIATFRHERNRHGPEVLAHIRGERTLSLADALDWADRNSAPEVRARLHSRAVAFILAAEVRRLRALLDQPATQPATATPSTDGAPE